MRLTSLDGIFGVFRTASEDAAKVWGGLGDDERRYVAALKACLICADVAGSIGRRGDEPMVDWMARAFRRVPSAEQLRRLVAGRLKGQKPYPFQEAVADRAEPVVFVKAGCGSGKT